MPKSYPVGHGGASGASSQPARCTGAALVRVIDVEHLGTRHSIGVWQVDDVLVDCGPESTTERLLAELGDWRPRAVLLTHIHLDHGGAAGALVRRWGDLEVYVHERGAPHLIDPEKLTRSAARLYGDDMQRMWGEIVPVPEANVRVLSGGERIGPFRVAYTPGHASHHVSFLHEDNGTAFVGDVAGVRIMPNRLTLPHAPPPDIDLPAWRRSLDAVGGWGAARLALPHYGIVDDVEEQLELVWERLNAKAELASRLDEHEFVEHSRAELAAELEPDDIAVYLQTSPPDHMHAGLRRYLERRSAPS
jgi:glyoxylase-like metal-dependent hydrolase (beta-lactamase superfamily II)